MQTPWINRSFLQLVVVAIVVAACSIGVSHAQTKATKEAKQDTVVVQEWLRLGPLSAPFPAFSNEGKKKPKAGDLLKHEHIARTHVRPKAGVEVKTFRGQSLQWQEVQSDTGRIKIEPDGNGPQVAYLAAYVDLARWTEIDFEVQASHPFELWVDDESITESDKPGSKKKKGSAKLVRGKHKILVKTVYAAGDSAVDWIFKTSLSSTGEPARPSVDPARTLTIRDILDAPGIRSMTISPDGKLCSISMQKRQPPKGKADRWVEIRSVSDGKLLRTLRDVSGSSWQWAPVGERLSYVTRNDDAGTLRVLDVDTGESQTIVENIKDFSSYRWSPDGSYVIYSINKKPEKDKTGVQRLRGVSDRRAGNRNQSSLYVASVPSGAGRRLTAGEHSTFAYDVHPDNASVMIGRTYEELSDRPFRTGELYLLDFETNSTSLLWKDPWLGSAQWSPDGDRILMTGGPSAFDGIGAKVPDGVTPNDYDTQAFLLDPNSKSVDPITKDFDPTIVSAFWPKPGRDIFVVAQDGEYVHLFRYEIKRGKFTKIDIDCDVIHRCVVARDQPVALVLGSKANRPARLYSVDLKSGRSSEILDAASSRFDVVRIGEVEDWNFEASSGKQIFGRVQFPPGFDPSRKWPCIVYYYGGTSPVSRSFGGRYPKSLWAAHGYVVYTLQPSGATGFGQEFSARHVNDWGKIVADEIIEGTKKFLAANDYADPDRVGCIGASFGGFMTQLLVTKTDLFAAAVSHAGISMISSYWGEGYWGYGYNSISAANSYPWNRPDIYNDQSPLFGAENVSTPLLLLHGSADTNVPPGESEQMYTALKLLGKEVEYIRVEGENHWIVDYEKRIVWNDAIVSWFDRWLKEQPEWWNDMYPPLADGE